MTVQTGLIGEKNTMIDDINTNGDFNSGVNYPANMDGMYFVKS